MSSLVTTVTGPSCSDECGMHDLAAEIRLEICSFLEVQDQLAMRKVCKLWRSTLSPVFLSQYVDMDASKVPEPSEIQEMPQDDYYDSRTQQYLFPEQYQYERRLVGSEELLEHALDVSVQKNTKILVLRHLAYQRNEFAVVARVIKEKGAELIQLILKDCEAQEEAATVMSYWTPNSQRVTNWNFWRLRCLHSATKRLVLDNYTMWNVLTGVVTSWFHMNMPSLVSMQKRLNGGNIDRQLTIVLPRHEFDCSKPFLEQYHSFMMALEAHCPEVIPEVRNDVVELYSSWIHDEVDDQQWHPLGNLISCYRKGVLVTKENIGLVDVPGLRQLDPVALNNLTTEALHRMYCLPPGVAEEDVTLGAHWVECPRSVRLVDID